MSGIAAKARIKSSERFQFIFDSVGDGILVCDAETGRITEVNAAGCAMFGAAREDLVGRTIGALSTGVPPYGQRDAMSWLDQARSAGPKLFEWHCKAKNGRFFWGEILLRCVSLGDRPVGVAIVRDITERKRKLDEVAEQARHDMLTGLPNRRDFDDRLQHELARCERYGGLLSVAMGDIDNFKIVNDTFGHQIGDEVLKRLAQFLRKDLRRTDYIARWGGEEFTMLLPGTRLEAATTVLERVRTTIASYTIAEIGGAVTLSFGVTEFVKSDTPAGLLNRVDHALYQSKQNGRNQVTISRPP